MQTTVRVFVPKQTLFVVCLTVLFAGMGGNSWAQSTGNCTSLISENFDYGNTPSTDLTSISGGNWTCFADCSPAPAFNYSPSRVLTYSGYADAAAGGAANLVGLNKTDISRKIPSPVTGGDIYMSFLMNFTSVTTSANAYFLSFKDNSTSSANYYGKLAPSQTSSTTYSLGFTKTQNVPSQAYSGSYQYGTTYLVVIKYSFVPGKNNDVAKAWVFSSGVPATEPPTATFTATDVSFQDAVSLDSISLLQQPASKGYVDGIRVATTWQDALCQTTTAAPTAYQWLPTAGSADFNTSTNWSPARNTPFYTDILNFTNGGASTATNVPGQGIWQMNVSNNTSIVFSSSSPSVLVINDDPNVNAVDLTIDAGSSLIIDSDNPLEINLVNAATASVSGNVAMQNTAKNVGRNHRFSSETANGITFNPGSVFTAQKLFGAAFGNTTANSVSFLSGSTYIAGDGSNPFALTAPASVVIFNPGSNYIHLGSTIPSFAGRKYGNFEFKTASTYSANIGSSTAIATIQNNFTITSGTLNFTGASQPLNIVGNMSVVTGATLNYNPSSTTSAAITLSGTTPQTISGTGTLTLGNNSTLFVNNAAGVSLSRDLTVGGTVNLLSGSFAVEANTLTLNGPAITGTPANLTTTNASSLVFGGSSTGIVIPSSVAVVNNLTINNAYGVTLGSNPTVSGVLSLANGPFILTGRTLTVNGSVSRSNGSLTGSPSTNLILDGPALKALYFTSPSNVVQNLTINAGATNVSLDNALDITSGSASGIVICNGVLNTNGNLTLKSDELGTAAVGQSSGIINGNVTVERFTNASLNQGQARRAWRLITSPVSGTTIRQAWQENGISGNTTTYGTLITGESFPDAATAATQGYDFVGGAGNHTSIKHYVNDAWVPLNSDGTVTGTNIDVRKEQAYMLFVRGDRNVRATGTSLATLRATGTLLQGDQSPISIGTGNYTVIGNPYACTIDFGTIAARNTNIKDQFYLWNSKLNNNGYGAYVLVDHNGSNGTYRATPSPLAGGSNVSDDNYRYIPSGSGFMVSPLLSASPGSLTVKESDKASASNPPVNPFRVVPKAKDVRELIVNLNLRDSNTSAGLADGFRAMFSPDYEGSEQDNSTAKVYNFNENLYLVRQGKAHIIEARGEVKKTDTLFMKMYYLTKRAYQLQMKADNFTNAPAMRAWLEDNYLKTKQEILLSGSITTLNFEVNGDSLSSANDRFRILFENATVLPVTVTQISACPKNGGTEVSWMVSNEANVKSYMVERSTDGGRTFITAGTPQTAKNNGQAAITSYAGFDATPQLGDNLYRIRIEAKDGTITYSRLVKVTIGENGATVRITLYPNPVKEGKASLQLSNLKEGAYLVSLYSGGGEGVYQRKVYITGQGSTHTEELHLAHLAQGTYQIKIADKVGRTVYEDKLVVAK